MQVVTEEIGEIVLNELRQAIAAQSAPSHSSAPTQKCWLLYAKSQNSRSLFRKSLR